MEQKNQDNKMEKYRKRVRDGYYLNKKVYELIASHFLEALSREGERQKT